GRELNQIDGAGGGARLVGEHGGDAVPEDVLAGEAEDGLVEGLDGARVALGDEAGRAEGVVERGVFEDDEAPVSRDGGEADGGLDEDAESALGAGEEVVEVE